MSDGTARLCGILLFAAIFALLLYPRWEYNGHAAIVEVADSAVNALQIEDARRGEEYLGNYSRWGFHHPGPAFFYVYAAGGSLLHDGLRWVASHHGAHEIAGLLVQAAFFVTGFMILVREVGLRWFMALGLALSTALLLRAAGAFFSTWPPHVLLMPYFCYLAVCTAVASGNGRLTPLAIVCGSFLVHGHVAQTLLVVPTFVVAWCMLARKCRHAGEAWWRAPFRAFPMSHWAGVAVLTVALLPIAIDLARGGDSNFARIIDHLAVYSGDRRGLIESAAFLLSFVAGREELFVEASTWSDRLGVLLSGWIYLAAFVAAIVLGIVGLRRFPGSFVRSWLIILAVSAGLSYVWAITQAGGHEGFNSYYVYGLVAHAFLFGVRTLAVWLERWNHWFLVVPAVIMGLSPVAFMPDRPRFDPDGAPARVARDLRAIQAAQPEESERSFLLAFHGRDWPLAATVAMLLHRDGYLWGVSDEWSFMFKNRLGDALPSEQLVAGSAELWWLWGPGDPRPEGATEPLGPFLLQRAPPLLDPNETIEVVLDGPDIKTPFHTLGLSDPGTGGAWSAAREMVFYCRSSRPAEADVILELDAAPFLTGYRGAEEQRGVLICNGLKAGEVSLREEAAVSFTIPASMWNKRENVVLSLRFPDAQSPIELRLSGDRRKLGWLITRMVVGPAN